MTLPRKKLAMTAQTRSGFSWNRKGPGVRPLTMNAPINTAMVGDAGMPRVSSGTIEAFA